MASGTFWFICGSLGVQFAGMITGILCARILGQSGFGKLNLLRSTILMFGVLAGSGLGVVATKYVAEFRDSRPEHAGRLLGLLFQFSIIIGSLALLVCMILASPLALWAMGAIELSNP